MAFPPQAMGRFLRDYLTSLTDARVSLHSFLAGVSLFLFDLLTFNLFSSLHPKLATWLLLRLGVYIMYVCLLAGSLVVMFPVNSFKSYLPNAVRAFFLGLVFGLGLILTFRSLSLPYWRFGLYLCLLSFFHWSEYYVTALKNPDILQIEFYMLSHSKAYHMAAVSSWLEFWLEAWLLPDWLKFGCTWISLIGLLICMCGEALRKAAMITAASNFNHYIQHVRKSGHVLVTHGVYAAFRHPSYVGWFYWSIGTQLLLANPVCVVAYAVASWTFFSVRIQEEEIILINFFGEQYFDYQRRVGTGLPFIKGYRLDIP